MGSVSREVGVCSVSSETARTFPKVVTLFYITHRCVPPSCLCLLFGLGHVRHPGGHAVVSPHGFNLCLLVANDGECHCRFTGHSCLFGKVCIPMACPLSLCYVSA